MGSTSLRARGPHGPAVLMGTTSLRPPKLGTTLDELLTMGLELEVAPEGPLRPEHTEIHLDKPTYCAWDLKNPGSCVASVGNKRHYS
jgi:hypothetical protein